MDEVTEEIAVPHVYMSTGCLHGEHRYCQSGSGLGGIKLPAQCKFCAVPCICKCHQEAERAFTELVRLGEEIRD